MSDLKTKHNGVTSDTKSHIPYPKSSISLICLDLGGVCIRIASNWRHACDRAGIKVDGRSFETAADKIHKLSFAYETGAINSQRFCEELADALDIAPALVTRALDAYLIEPFDGITSFIHELIDVGQSVACLSNTNERHWQMMTGTIDCTVTLPMDRLTHCFASHEIGAMKPNAVIYEHVETKSELAPETILFFDDRPENIAAAINRGWQGLVIDAKANPVAQMRDHLRSVGVLP